jgi:hypothetical protein
MFALALLLKKLTSNIDEVSCVDWQINETLLCTEVLVNKIRDFKWHLILIQHKSDYKSIFSIVEYASH